MRGRISLLLVAVCFGCSDSATADEPGLVFRAQCAASEPGARPVTLQGQPAWFGVARTFELKFALPTTDAQGHPAITFHLAEKEILPFEAFTSVSVEGPLGIFLDGELIAAPAVQSISGGSFTFCNEAGGWTVQDRDRWLQRIQDSLGK